MWREAYQILDIVWEHTYCQERRFRKDRGDPDDAVCSVCFPRHMLRWHSER